MNPVTSISPKKKSPRATKAPRKVGVRKDAVTSADQQVRAQLAALSQALEETARQYVRRLQREIVDLSELLPTSPGPKGFSPKYSKKIRAITDKFSTLQIRPGKGRRKDLKRIDALIGELENILNE